MFVAAFGKKLVRKNLGRIIKKKNFSVTFDSRCEFIQTKEKVIVVKGTLFDAKKLEELESLKEMTDWLNETDGSFIALVYDAKQNKVFYLNDYYSSYQACYKKEKGTIYFSSDPSRIADGELFYPGFYDILAMGAVHPPDTIWKGVKALEHGQAAEINSKLSMKIKTYWTTLTETSKPILENPIEDVTEAFVETVKKRFSKYKGQIGFGLSGGIDSGGAMGIVRMHTKNKLKAYHIQPYGYRSKDVEKAKITAKFNKAEIQQIDYTPKMLEVLPQAMGKLSQPFFPAMAFSNHFIVKNAKKDNTKVLVYGFAADWVSATLVFYDYMRYVSYVSKIPNFIRWPIKQLALLVAPKKYSRHIDLVLGSRSLASKFYLYIKTPRTYHERHLFAKDFDWKKRMNKIMENMERSFANDVDFDYRVLEAEFNSHSYRQIQTAFEDHDAYGLEAFIPYYYREISGSLMRQPPKLRKKNNRNKWLLREVMKPFSDPRINVNDRSSLTISYERTFKGELLEKTKKFLKEHEWIGSFVNKDEIDTIKETVPAGGRMIFTFLAIAIWYDIKVKNKYPATTPLSKIIGYKFTKKDEELLR